MSVNPEEYIQKEIMRPVARKLHKLLHFRRLDSANRFDLELKKWDAEYHGVFTHASGGSPATVGSVQYRSITMNIAITVDGIPVSIKQFEFSKSLQEVSDFADALEGTAFGLMEVIEPIIEHGFCSHCNRPYQKTVEGKLTCRCIEQAESDASA